MYKTASKFQQHRAMLAANKKRTKKYISPLAAQYSRQLNALSRQMFGRPCKRLTKKQRNQLAEAVKQMGIIRRSPRKRSLTFDNAIGTGNSHELA